MRGEPIVAEPEPRDLGNQLHDWERQWDEKARKQQEERRRRYNLEAMAWVALIAFLFFGGLALDGPGGVSRSETMLAIAVVVALGLIVRLLIHVLTREGS